DARGALLLSKREQEVVRCVSEGLTNREIASRLKLSGHTVKNYIFKIFDKLGVSTRVELVLYAFSHRESSPSPTVPEIPRLLSMQASNVEWCLRAAEEGM